VTGWLAARDFVVQRIGPPLLGFAERRPGVFYGVLFVVSFEIATLFADGRTFAPWAWHSLQAI